MQHDTTRAWMPVALSADLPAGTVMPARLPAQSTTQPIALWRGQSGQPSASADRCPHRGMSLSHGFVRGETLSCIYHGWSYAQGGHCVRIPAHPGLTPPETIRVKTFPVAETGGILWVAAAEPTSPPPVLDGLRPLRSMIADAGVAAIEAAAGAKAGPDGLLKSAGALHLLLCPQENGSTLIHVLLEGEASPTVRIAASRAAENLRRAAEDLERQGSGQ